MQRGFSLMLLLFFVAILAIIGAGSFFFFNKQQIAAINSFDDCAKKYPIMESYPAQCNTPDGRHFVQQLSQEDIQKLVQPIESSASTKTVSATDTVNTENWKLYENKENGFSIKFPSWLISCGKDDLSLYEGQDISDCEAGEGPPFLIISANLERIADVDKSSYPDCFHVNKQNIQLNGIGAQEYTNTIVKDTGECTMPSAYARYEKHIVLNFKGKKILISDFQSTSQDIKKEILKTLRFMDY